MKVVLLVLLLAIATTAQGPTKPSVPVMDADQKEIAAALQVVAQADAEVQRANATAIAARAKLETATFKAMARARLSPDEYEIADAGPGKFEFRPKAVAQSKPAEKKP